MSRRRFLAASFFSLVIAAVLAVIVYTEHVNASQTVGVWMLVHNVSGGAPYASTDVQHLELRSDSRQLNYQALGPDAFRGRYAQNLSGGDILRQDDLIPVSMESEVALAVQDPPPLNTGDRVDIFATFANAQQALVGRGILIEAVSGGSLTVLVPAQDEASWVAIGASSVPLHVARTALGAPATGPPMSATDAIRVLCGSPCSAATPVTAAGP